MWAKVRGMFKKFQPLSSCVSVYLLAGILDMASSLYSNGSGDVIESNPFARDLNMQFLWKHLLAIDCMMLVLYSMICYCLYKLASWYSKPLGYTLASLPLLYSAYDRITNAVLSNILLAWHWYVPLHHLEF
jgi:hypothetical protein